MARRTKLTPETQEKILTYIRAGNYNITAAEACGISEKTFYNWIVRGEKEDELATKNSKRYKRGIYFQFLQEIKKAEAAGEGRLVTLVSKAAEENWQAAMTILERKYPKRWARRDRHEITGEDGGPVKVETDARSKLAGVLRRIANRATAGKDAGRTDAGGG